MSSVMWVTASLANGVAMATVKPSAALHAHLVRTQARPLLLSAISAHRARCRPLVPHLQQTVTQHVGLQMQSP